MTFSTSVFSKRLRKWLYFSWKSKKKKVNSQKTCKMSKGQKRTYLLEGPILALRCYADVFIIFQAWNTSTMEEELFHAFLGVKIKKSWIWHFIFKVADWRVGLKMLEAPNGVFCHLSLSYTHHDIDLVIRSTKEMLRQTPKTRAMPCPAPYHYHYYSRIPSPYSLRNYCDPLHICISARQHTPVSQIHFNCPELCAGINHLKRLVYSYLIKLCVACTEMALSKFLRFPVVSESLHQCLCP